MILEYDIITQGNIKRLDNGAIVNRYSHIVKGADIGKDVMIAEHCYIASGVIIGDKTRIQNFVSVWDGVTLGRNVFIGPAVAFTNCHDPHERHDPDRQFTPDKTYIGDNATIGAGCTIIAPCRVGEFARLGAGSVLLRDLEPNEHKNGIVKAGKKENWSYLKDKVKEKVLGK
jgi:acetyltransferase-like isoleucine patch superfamily enzyme